MGYYKIQILYAIQVVSPWIMITAKNFKITSSLVASYTKSNVAPSAIVGNLLLTPPSLPVYRTDGSFVVLSPFESALQNPINSLYNQLNETKTNRILGNVAGEIGIIDGLKLKVLFGVDILITNKIAICQVPLLKDKL
jgi:hypothetical protein